MRGKANEMAVAPAKNFRIAAADAESDVKETPVAARTPDTPLGEVYSDPNAAKETAAIAATDAVVEAPQVNGAANGAAATDGPSIDHDHEQRLEEQELEGEAADMARRLWRFEPKLNTLKGNICNHLLDVIKVMPKPWAKMGEIEQRAVIRQLDDIGGSMVTTTVNIVAARGFKHHEVRIGKFTVDREKELVEAKLVSHLESELVDSMCEDTSCMIVFRNSEGFYSEAKERKPEPTTIGSLAIPIPERHQNGAPTSGPGTPTPPEVMDAVGKGLEAAAQAAAVVAAAEPAPAPTTVA